VAAREAATRPSETTSCLIHSSALWATLQTGLLFLFLVQIVRLLWTGPSNQKRSARNTSKKSVRRAVYAVKPAAQRIVGKKLVSETHNRPSHLLDFNCLLEGIALIGLEKGKGTTHPSARAKVVGSALTSSAKRST